MPNLSVRHSICASKSCKLLLTMRNKNINGTGNNATLLEVIMTFHSTTVNQTNGLANYTTLFLAITHGSFRR